MKNLRKPVLTLFMIVTAALATVAQSAPVKLEGNWLTTLEFSGTKRRLIVRIEKSADGYTAKFDSPDQGVTDLPIDSVTLDANKMSFIAAKFGMSYQGVVNEAANEITGTFKQRADETPMVFRRVTDVPKLNRPQEPKKPYPYDEEEVSYKNEKDNVKIAGTLTIPRGGSSHPVVLLITGSGSQDRDESIAGHRPFLVLADHLTRKGIAVLRLDDRGMGGTDGGSPSATGENLAEDVLAGIRFLKTRKEIDSKKIGLIGHSEGGMIAPIVATRSDDVSFIVLLAGLGQRGEDVIYKQLELIHKAQGSDPETIKHAVALAKRIHAIVKSEPNGHIEQRIKDDIAAYAGTLNDVQRKQFESVEAAARAFMPVYQIPWYRHFIMFDPAPVLKQVKVPVLALNGELDLQVAWKENLELISAGLKAGKNNDVTIKAFPKLNHLFQTSQTGLLSEYGQIEETMNPEVLETVSDWILSRTSKKSLVTPVDGQ